MRFFLLQNPSISGSKNSAAQRLYFSLGYEKVGELKDYLVLGHSEIILRKTTGPVVPNDGKTPENLNSE